MICDKCERTLNNFTCEQPCELCCDEMDRDLVGVSYGLNEYKSDCDNEFLNDYLEYDVEDQEWLDVLNGNLTIEKMIDYNSLFRYMQTKNDEYSEASNLCPECHTPLIKKQERGEVWGAKNVVYEEYWICPHCG